VKKSSIDLVKLEGINFVFYFILSNKMSMRKNPTDFLLAEIKVSRQ